jgi:hypothetical protein
MSDDEDPFAYDFDEAGDEESDGVPPSLPEPHAVDDEGGVEMVSVNPMNAAAKQKTDATKSETKKGHVKLVEDGDAEEEEEERGSRNPKRRTFRFSKSDWKGSVLRMICSVLAFVIFGGACVGLIFGITDLRFKNYGLGADGGTLRWGKIWQTGAGLLGVGTDSPSALLEINNPSDGSNSAAETLRLAQPSTVNRRRRLASATGQSSGDTSIVFGEYYGDDFVRGSSMINSGSMLSLNGGPASQGGGVSLNTGTDGNTLVGGGGRVCIKCAEPTSELDINATTMHRKEAGFQELTQFYKTIRLGSTNISTHDGLEPGEMRWTGSDFEGFTMDREWTSMTKTFEVTNATGNFRQIPYWVAKETESYGMYGAEGFEWYNEASTLLLSHAQTSRALRLAFMRGTPYIFNSTHMYDAEITYANDNLAIDSQYGITVGAGTSVVIDANGGALALSGSTSVDIHAEGGSSAVNVVGKTIKLQTSSTSDEVEVTNGLLKSGGSSQLALTGASSVAIRAASGALTMSGSSGASMVAVSGDATISATSGTIILNGNVEVSSSKGLQVQATTVAAAGSSQTDASAISSGLSMVKITGSAGQGVKLPTAVEGNSITLLRGSVTIVMNVYAASSDFINGESSSATAFAMTAGTNIIKCIALSASSWDCTRVGTETMPAIDLESGSSYTIGGTAVLSSNTLGNSVVSSSLTTVGTLGSLNVANNVQLGDASSDTVDVQGYVEIKNGMQQTATVVAAETNPSAFSNKLSMVSVTNTGSGQSVMLPSATIGAVVTLIRSTSSNIMSIKPSSTEIINAAGQDAVLSWAVNHLVIVCIGVSTNQWECQRRGSGAVSRRRLFSTNADAPLIPADQTWSQWARDLYPRDGGLKLPDDITANDVDVVALLQAQNRRLELYLVAAIAVIFILVPLLTLLVCRPRKTS